MDEEEASQLRLTATCSAGQAFDFPAWGQAIQLTLTTNHRAKQDMRYADLLARMRVGKITADDIERLMLRACRHHACNRNTPHSLASVRNSMTLCATNKQVDLVNSECIASILEDPGNSMERRTAKLHRAQAHVVDPHGKILQTLDL